MKRFCHLCGAKYLAGQEQPWKCSGCGSRSYANPAPGVDVVLFDKRKSVLIAERAADPGRGLYDLPGGFVEVGETFEQGLLRELEEELGLSSADITQLRYVRSQILDYQWGEEIIPTVTATFAVQLVSEKHIEVQDDVSSVLRVTIDELEEYQFLNPIHVEVVRTAYRLLFDS